MPGQSRRQFVWGAARAGFGAIALAALARAEEPYPSRPVELIVPFAPGGGTDLIARLLCDGLAKRLGQPFVALNRAGANTNVGTQLATRAKPDGYSLLMASIGLAANPSLYKKLPFDPLADLAPISLIANAPTVLVVHPSMPVDTVPALIAYLKEHPGALNYASYGAGSSPHLAAELFQATTGTRMVHVPYSGGGPAALGVVSNAVHMLFPSLLPVLGMMRGGTLKAIAVAAERRLPLLPEVPTFEESGIDYRTGTWFGVLAPAGTDETVMSRLHGALIDLLQEPAARDKLIEQGAEVVGNSPAEFRAFIQQETARLAVVIRNAGIQLD